MMIKLLLKTIVNYIDGGFRKMRVSDDTTTVVIYEITNKDGVKFTRIDIFTRDKIK